MLRPYSCKPARCGFLSLLRSMHQQRAFRLERAQLFRVEEPTARVNLRRRRAIDNSLVRHVCKTCGAEMLCPFFCGEKMRWHREKISPLVGVRIVAVVVNEEPR